MLSVRQGEIWNVSLNPTIGDEISKIRPCVVLDSDGFGVLQIRVVAPITEWRAYFEEYPWMIKLTQDEYNGLYKTSSIDTRQIRSLSYIRFQNKVGVVSGELLKSAHIAIVKAFDMRYILN